MIKCPMCGKLNEDGTLFCDQCVSDLADVPPLSPEEAAVAGPPPSREPELVPLDGDLTVPDAGVPEAEVPAMDATIPEEEVVLGGAPMAEALSRVVPPSQVASVPSKVAPIPSKAAPPSKVAPMPSKAAPPPTKAPPAAAPPVPRGAVLPPGAKPKLVVLRGRKPNLSYPICDGANFIGRSGDQPVDIDLSDQEAAEGTWTSRQHACISFENGNLFIEDLKSANGTFVNRGKLPPNQKRPLAVGDIVQVGRVHMKVQA